MEEGKKIGRNRRELRYILRKPYASVWNGGATYKCVRLRQVVSATRTANNITHLLGNPFVLIMLVFNLQFQLFMSALKSVLTDYYFQQVVNSVNTQTCTHPI